MARNPQLNLIVLLMLSDTIFSIYSDGLLIALTEKFILWKFI